MTGPAVEITPDGEVKDFTLAAQPKRFRIGDDQFQAPAIMSPKALVKLGKLHAAMVESGAGETRDIEAMLTRVGEMFRLFLPGPSGERFDERLQSETEPIDLQRQAIPIMYWLMEQYGMRPTQPSSPSPNGLTDEPTDTPSGGISSTAGASAEASHI